MTTYSNIATGPRKVTLGAANIIAALLVHPSYVAGTFDFISEGDSFRWVHRQDEQLPFKALTGSPQGDTERIVTVYRSDDAAFVEDSGGVRFIGPEEA